MDQNLKIILILMILKNISKESSWEWKSGTKGTMYKIPITKDIEIDYLMFLIKQKYNSLLN
jgi:hypothetical protein